MGVRWLHAVQQHWSHHHAHQEPPRPRAPLPLHLGSEGRRRRYPRLQLSGLRWQHRPICRRYKQRSHSDWSRGRSARCCTQRRRTAGSSVGRCLVLLGQASWMTSRSTVRVPPVDPHGGQGDAIDRAPVLRLSVSLRAAWRCTGGARERPPRPWAGC